MRQFILRLVLLAIIILVVFGVYRLLTVHPLKPAPFFAAGDFLIIADTGQNSQAPPYTLPAFQSAVSAGATGLFLPLYLTRDGELVVLPGPDLADFGDGGGQVAEMTLAEVAALDAGYAFDPAGDGSFPLRGQGLRFVTLRQVLASFPEARIIASIRAPSERAVAALLSAIDAENARDRFLVHLDHQRLAESLRQQAPDLATTYTGQELGAFLTTYRLRLVPFYRPAAQALLLDVGRMDAGLVEAAASRGVRVMIMVGQQTEDILLWRDEGVAGVVVRQ